MDGAEHILAHFKENRAQIQVLMDDVIDAQLDVKFTFQDTFYLKISKAKVLLKGTIRQ